MKYTDSQLLDHYERTHPYTSRFTDHFGKVTWQICNHAHPQLRGLTHVSGESLRDVLAADLDRIPRRKA